MVRVTAKPIESLCVPIQAHGFGLQDGCRRPSWGHAGVMQDTIYLQMLVDRSGFEPLISAVHTHLR